MEVGKGAGTSVRVAASKRPGRPTDEGGPAAETRKQRQAAVWTSGEERTSQGMSGTKAPGWRVHPRWWRNTGGSAPGAGAQHGKGGPRNNTVLYSALSETVNALGGLKQRRDRILPYA